MDHETVRRYYGETLASSADLRTDACCDASAVPDRIKPLLARIHDDVLARYYGCGTVVPERLRGATVLDLGCGTGRDVYLLAQLVGPEGRVIGVDMTPEQLAVARDTLGWHRERLGAEAPEIAFHDGLIERLGDLPLAPGSVDVIVSNCVVNLSPDKRAVLAGAARLLKPGGEMYFSDVYADRRVPEALKADPVLYGECLSGALYWRDFLALAAEAGFAAPRVVSARRLSVTDPEQKARVGEIGFFSAETRPFRLAGPAPGAEDYGQAATYLGGIEEADDAVALDRATRLPRGERTPVDAETFAILSESRLAPCFALDPGDGVHRGPFDAGDTPLPRIEARAGGCCG